MKLITISENLLNALRNIFKSPKVTKADILKLESLCIPFSEIENVVDPKYLYSPKCPVYSDYPTKIKIKQPSPSLKYDTTFFHMN